jgi:hypothetical protein
MRLQAFLCCCALGVAPRALASDPLELSRPDPGPLGFAIQPTLALTPTLRLELLDFESASGGDAFGALTPAGSPGSSPTLRLGSPISFSELRRQAELGEGAPLTVPGVGRVRMEGTTIVHEIGAIGVRVTALGHNEVTLSVSAVGSSDRLRTSGWFACEEDLPETASPSAPPEEALNGSTVGTLCTTLGIAIDLKGAERGASIPLTISATPD